MNPTDDGNAVTSSPESRKVESIELIGLVNDRSTSKLVRQ